MSSSISAYVLWSTLLVISGDNGSSVGVHQVTTQNFANKASCYNAMDILAKGRSGKKVERSEDYIRTLVEVEGALMVNRLQCMPLDVTVEQPEKK